MYCEMLIHPEELSKKWIDKLYDAGVDVLGIHPWGGNHAKNSISDLVEILKTKEYRALINYAKERGLKIEYELHAADYLMPKELFLEHPEYFRMNENGERVNDGNFCVSSVEALSLFSSAAAKLAVSLYGSSNKFYFWMSDGKNKRCHCPKCKMLSPSDQQMIATNSMLKSIREKIPDAKMAYLAYYDSVLPPELIKPDENVFLEYAPFEKYTAKGDDAEFRIKREKEIIPLLFDTFGKKDAKVLEYWYDNSYFSKWKKPPCKFELNQDKMICDMKELFQLGFNNIATFACFLGEDYHELYGDVDITPFTNCFKSLE